MIKNKRSQAADILIGIIIFFTLAFVILIANLTYNKIADKLVNNTQINSSTSAVNVLQEQRTIMNRLDLISFGFMMALLLAVIIIGYFVAANPIYSFIYLIVLIIVIIASGMMSFGWDKVSKSTMIVQYTRNLPVTNNIMQNLPLYTTLIGFIGMISLYAKPFISRV